MADLPKKQTEICRACGIVHAPRHWAEDAANTRPSTQTTTSSQTTQRPPIKEATERHSIWQDKAGQFIAHFSRTKTEPLVAEHEHHDQPERLHRRSSSFSRRDSGLGALDMRDGLIEFRDKDGCFDRESDHVITKKK